MNARSNAAKILAKTAARAAKALGAGEGSDWSAVPALLDAFEEDATRLAGLELSAEEARLAEEDFEGEPALMELAALLGEAFRASYGGRWNRPLGRARFLIESPDGAAFSWLDAELLARHILEETEFLDLRAFAKSMDERMELARAASEPGARASAEQFSDEYSHLADLDHEELQRWTASKAEEFRGLWEERTGERLSYAEEEGIVALDQLLHPERYHLTLDPTTRHLMACFLGECARREWSDKTGRKTAWHWIGAHDNLGLAFEADEEDFVGGVFLPYEEIRAALHESSKRRPLSQAVKEFPKRAEHRHEEREFDAHATTEKMEAIEDELDHDTPYDLEDTAKDATPWKLAPGIAINGSVFEMRRRTPGLGSGTAPDLMIPCAEELARGALPLAVVPIEGAFFPSEDDLVERLGQVVEQIDAELARNKLKASLYVYFSYVQAARGDLVVVLQPPLLVGGRREVSWFFWPDDAPRPVGPLDAEARRKLDLFDPVMLQVRQALFHLQRTGDATEARRLLEEAHAKMPDHPTVLMALCSLHIAIGNQITARGYIQRVLDVDPKNIEAQLLDARFLLDEGLVEQAAERAESVLRNDMNHPDAYLVRARVRLAKGMTESARSDVARAREIEPDNQEAMILQRLLEGVEVGPE